MSQNMKNITKYKMTLQWTQNGIKMVLVRLKMDSGQTQYGHNMDSKWAQNRLQTESKMNSIRTQDGKEFMNDSVGRSNR